MARAYRECGIAEEVMGSPAARFGNEQGLQDAKFGLKLLEGAVTTVTRIDVDNDYSGLLTSCDGDVCVRMFCERIPDFTFVGGRTIDPACEEGVLSRSYAGGTLATSTDSFSNRVQEDDWNSSSSIAERMFDVRLHVSSMVAASAARGEGRRRQGCPPSVSDIFSWELMVLTRRVHVLVTLKMKLSHPIRQQ
ncbi:hypothetical protein MAE02_02950 [Microvirga aerophila]|uniref:Uncharacterized protein n=1 Tax=Microvirga aerophila TaxID=670291 RepID=A0A512BKV1_9HYPH|nr:hypothetical protein MAE02_02950 [Microvirga aerophila]